jgi:hypothetical protein
VSNKQIKGILQELSYRVDVAKTKDELLSAVAKSKTYGKPLVYNFTKHILFALCLLILSLAAVLWTSFIRQGMISNFLNTYSWLSFAGIIGVVASVALFAYIFNQKTQVSNLAKHIFKKDALLDNNLTLKAPFNGEEMRIRFREFDRGNYSREFKEVIGGEFSGQEHTFSYDYYHFHYVDKRKVTTTTHDSKGRTTTSTRTVYDRYDRYGIIVPFEFVQSLQIFSFRLSRTYPTKVTTGSIAFDKSFKVRANEELAAAKFLKPAVVVAIQDVSEFLTKMNIEIDATGRLCLSFANNDMVMGNQRFDLADPEAFYTELAGQTNLRLLERSLRFIHQLMKHCDSNF